MEQLNNEQIAEKAHTAEAENNLGGFSEATSLAKFKDVESLQKAYGCLEAEFTKRCQRLKQLEAETEELKAELLKKGDTEIKENAESLKAQSAESGDSAKEIEDFFKRFPQAICFADKISDIAVSEEGLGEKGFMDRAYARFLSENSTKKLTEEELIEQIDKTSLREKIVQEFLSGVKNSKPKTVILAGGGQIPVAPPYKPKTLLEAAMLAKEIIKLK